MKIITTVGTSLFTNYGDNLGKEFENKEYWKNIKRYETRLEPILDKLKKFIDDKKYESCAELSSIKKFIDKRNIDKNDIEIVLIATDTMQSYLVAEVLKKFLEKNNYKVHFKENKFHIIKYLNIDNQMHFQQGVDNLIEAIFKFITKNGEVLQSSEVVFNISGGYKGIIPYTTLIAQIFKYEIIYTFENQDSELLIIDALPIEFSRGLLELYFPYLNNLNIINNNIRNELENIGLIKNNELTSLGKIALYSVKNTPLSKDVFGHFIEYKIYEYFVQKLFDNSFHNECLNFEYSKVGHGVGLGKNLTDIDIMLQKENEIVWIEVKPISYLIDEKKKNELLVQIRDKQVGKWSELNFRDKELKKYILIVYLYDKTLLKEIQVKEIQDLFENKKIDFAICYFQISLSKSDKRKKSITSATYQTIMKDFQIKKLERIENV